MNTHDIDIELPPLPKGDIAADTCPVMWVHTDQQTENYAREAIEADRQQQGEVVVTKDEAGYIVAVTRQDKEGRILSVIAEADRKRRGEPVAWLRKNGFRFNAEIEPRDDSELPLYTTPQSAEPVKKKPYAQGTALGEFGVIPMCDQMDDEPVKVDAEASVPSDMDIDDLSREWGLLSAAYPSKMMVRDFARALLARYG